MPIKVQIKKKLDSFLLDREFQSESRRIGILGASTGLALELHIQQETEMHRRY